MELKKAFIRQLLIYAVTLQVLVGAYYFLHSKGFLLFNDAPSFFSLLLIAVALERPQFFLVGAHPFFLFLIHNLYLYRRITKPPKSLFGSVLPAFIIYLLVIMLAQISYWDSVPWALRSRYDLDVKTIILLGAIEYSAIIFLFAMLIKGCLDAREKKKTVDSFLLLKCNFFFHFSFHFLWFSWIGEQL